MNSSQRSVYFPLRSNAKALVAGAPVESVRRRLKLCSLFFDQVYVESGALSIVAGPTGCVTFPIPQSPGKKQLWQGGASRRSGGTPFRLGFRRDGQPEAPWRTAMQTEATVNWEPTFEPFRDELPALATSWLHFGVLKPNPLVKPLALAGARADNALANLRAKFPDQMVRSQVLSGLNTDLAATGLHGLAVSMDSLHREVVALRASAGATQPVCGPSSLKLLFPKVERLPWDAISDLREHRDIADFRRMLVEVEGRAIEADSGTFEGAAKAAYDRAVQDATARVEGSALRKYGLMGFGLFAGELVGAVLGGVPVVGSVVGTALGDAAERAIKAIARPRWMAFDRQLRRSLSPSDPA